MKKIWTIIIASIAAMSLIIVLAFTAVQLVAFDESRYESAYERYDRYAFIGIAQEDLHDVTHEMLQYLKGKRNDLVMSKNIAGENQQVFEEREILHMEDVRKLFLGGMMIRNITAIIAVVGLIALFLLVGKKAIYYLSVCWLWVLGVLIVLIAILGILMLIDFSAVFWQFHLLFFDNDLWLLDIETDVLIQMFPEAFFNEMAMAIMGAMGVAVVTPGIAAGSYLGIRRKRGKAQ